MTNRRQNSYQTTEILTADPGKLILLLYDGAISNLRAGKEKLEENDYEGKGLLLMKAHDIISELLNTLDLEKGGEIAQRLKMLYGYLLKRILDADLKKEVRAIDEVISHLTHLREAWETIILKKSEDVPISQDEFRQQISAIS